MYDRMSDVLEIAMMMQRIRHEFDRYAQERDRSEILQARRIAELEIQCEQLRARNEAINLYAEHFLEECERLRGICMSSLERAIEKGDKKIAELSLEILEELYGDQFIKTIGFGF